MRGRGERRRRVGRGGGMGGALLLGVTAPRLPVRGPCLAGCCGFATWELGWGEGAPKGGNGGPVRRGRTNARSRTHRLPFSEGELEARRDGMPGVGGSPRGSRALRRLGCAGSRTGAVRRARCSGGPVLCMMRTACLLLPRGDQGARLFLCLCAFALGVWVCMPRVRRVLVRRGVPMGTRGHGRRGTVGDGA